MAEPEPDDATTDQLNIESEDWDVDDGPLPQSHEAAVTDLLQRNVKIFERQAEVRREMEVLEAQFDDSIEMAKSTGGSTRWSTDQSCGAVDHHQYSLVQSDPKKLFVSNIDFKTSQWKLWEFFAQFGQVRYCQLLKYPNNKSKGRGFVTFAEEASAKHVLTLGSEELNLDDRRLYVEQATWKKRKSDQQKEEKQEVACPDHDYADGECAVGDCSDTADGAPVHGECYIDVLTDDLILLVYKYLSLKELFTCERVCKRWRNLCLRHWKIMRCLSFNFLRTRFVKGFNESLFCSLLKRDCPALQSIDLTMLSTCLGDGALDHIGNYCPQIVELNLSEMMISTNSLQKLAAKCTQLRKVVMRKCQRISEKGFWTLFRRCRELEEVIFDENKKIIGKCFHVGGGHLQKVSLVSCTELQDVALEKLCTTSRGLKGINLRLCTSLTSSGISHLSQSLSLEVLHLSGCEMPVASLQLENLVNLIEVYLEDNYAVTVQFLNDLAVYCTQLKVLDISGTDVILKDVKYLASFKCLHTLKANRLGVTGVWQNMIKEVRRLEVLHLRSCQDLLLSDVEDIMTHGSELKELDISYTDLDNSALSFIISTLHTQPDHHLLLHAHGTGMDPENVSLPENMTFHKSGMGMTDMVDGYSAYSRFVDLDDEDYFDNDDPHGEFEEFGDAAAAYHYLDGDDPLFEEQFDLS